MRVKTDIGQTIQAYYTLYKSAVTFSQRKMLQADHGMPQLVERVAELEDRKQMLDNRIIDLKQKLDITIKRIEKKREFETTKR